MIKQFVFDLPPSLNSVINTARRNQYSSAEEKRRLTAECYLIALGKGQFKGPVWIESFFYLKRKRDIDNCILKFALDGLQEAGVIRNDSLIQSPSIKWVEKVKKGEEPRLKLLVSDKPLFCGRNIELPQLLAVSEGVRIS